MSGFGHDDLRELHRRLGGLVVFVVLVFVFLLARAWSLQVVHGRNYREQSESNRLRVVNLQSHRGLIYDRNGKLLVNNVPSFTLYFVLEDMKKTREEITRRVAPLIRLSSEEIDRRINNRRDNVPYLPVKIKENLSLQEVALIETHKLDLPGVKIEVEPRRNYIYGTFAAHLLGHVGEVTGGQLEDNRYAGVLPGTIVGQYGVERSLDPIIRGTVGQKIIEVDALGHEKRISRSVPPVKGDDVYLTIDLDTQKAAEDALGSEAGAIVALDPTNGDVLAMASHPAFDPNQMSTGLSAEQWRALISDSGHPLTNRAIQGQYPPGSTFKIVMSTAGLETKEISETFKVNCRGFFPFGNRAFRDWKKEGHGVVDLHRAIVESCDVFFYELGRRLGIDTIAHYAEEYGLGKPTGIDLASEKSGIVPSTAWKRQVKKQPWFPGETISAAIGQGYVSVTPLQLAVMMSAVSNEGHVYRPRFLVGKRVSGSVLREPGNPKEVLHTDISNETFAFLKTALKGVVDEPHGTGGLARSKLVTIGGKTGTAQVVGQKAGARAPAAKRFADHAWFVAMAPVESSRIVVTVLVEHGGHGGSMAAPLAKKVIEAYLGHDRSQAPGQL